MAATWIGIGLAIAGLLVTLITVLIRVAVNLALNTKATKDLLAMLNELKEKSACHDDTLANHEQRLGRIEMVPEVKKAIA